MTVTRRTKRVAELIRHELGGILHTGVNDPRVDLRLLTVTRVEVTPDLLEARVYVSLIGSDANERTALRGLNSARRRMRAELGERTELRCVPDLVFRIDEERKRSRHMHDIFAELARERDDAPEAPEQPEPRLTPMSEDDTDDGRQQ